MLVAVFLSGWLTPHVTRSAASPWRGGPPAVDPQDPHFLVAPPLNATAAGAEMLELPSYYPVGYYPCIDGVIHQDPSQLESFYQLLIDRQVASGVNYMRQVLSMGQPADASSLPYELAAPGSQRVDLTRFNQAHFDLWDRVLSYAARHGVVVQLILLDAWHNKKWVVETDSTMSWGLKYDFYVGSNNVNGVNASTPQQWVDPRHPVFAVQKALVDKAVRELGHHPNVVWEVANEPSEHNGSWQEWVDALAETITAAETAGVLARHLVIPRDIPGHQSTPGHWNDNVSVVHSELVARWNGNGTHTVVSPLLADNDCCAPPSALYARERAWAAFTAGAQSSFLNVSIRDSTTLLAEGARRGMQDVGSVGIFVDRLKVNLRGLSPLDHLVTSGWCIGRHTTMDYIVYLIHGGETSFLAGTLPPLQSISYVWFNPRTGQAGAVQNAHADADGGAKFYAQDTQDWALYVRSTSTNKTNAI